jgi:hypothetical protein
MDNQLPFQKVLGHVCYIAIHSCFHYILQRDSTFRCNCFPSTFCFAMVTELFCTFIRGPYFHFELID